jgi:hypothetical protein
VSLCIPSSSRSPDHDPHRTIYYLGYPLGRFAGLKHRQPVLLDSEPQTRVYQIHPLDKVCVLFACPLVLTCSSICLQVQGCSWHSKNNTIGGGVTVATVQLQPLWCCSRAAQRRSSSNRVIPHSHRKIRNKP